MGVQKPTEVVKKQATGLYKLAEALLKVIDAKTAVALMMVALAMGIASAPEAGAAASLAAFGISPRGFAYGCGLAAGLILRFPNTHFYTLLISPLIVYIVAFADYLGKQPNVCMAPLAWYLGFMYLALKAGQKEGGGSGL